ncbi:uncharacterized protein LTR77_001564 [Saxophila tyrrhenica]|uniref:NAD-dependent epimerase/dehydratase domain-containing protein n=1 Tax=Saxophila tyrrhenica TaxID=1690608 RepID=A0AAV9PQB7_9PEZI|nr:hypothetical protein LTR77_001564 [Saxophila tyrrhenica]
MHHNILLTGASGYLGGSLLAAWSSANLPPHGKLHALVRTDKQADDVRQYGAEPVRIDVSDPEAIRQCVVERQITIVLWLIDAMRSEGQVAFIKALGEVKGRVGGDVHFVHVWICSSIRITGGQALMNSRQTSGAKIFSSHAGAPTDGPLLDTAPDLYDIQKAQVPKLSLMGTVRTFSQVPPLRYSPTALTVHYTQAVTTNNTVIETGEAAGVKSYIFIPCIVYGKGTGPNNKISIQTTAIVRAALSQKRVYSVDDGKPVPPPSHPTAPIQLTVFLTQTWPVCHISDNTTLYLALLRRILAGPAPPSGKQGYYLAASGSVAWNDLYVALARALTKRGEVVDEKVERADEGALEGMAGALGCGREYVGLQVGGLCTFTAKRGEEIGWKPGYAKEHIFEAADDEVKIILEYEKGG